MVESIENLKRLSSPYTFYYKFVLPVIWLVAFAVITLLMLLNEHQAAYIFVGIAIIGFFVFLKFVFPLKVVWLGDDHLVVGNFFRKVRINFYSIESIKENKWLNTHNTTIKLTTDTEFGQKIVFMPYRTAADMFRFFKDSAVTTLLKEKVEKYKKL